MKKIKLTQGKYALVDDEDYRLLKDFRWHAALNKGNWYARTSRNGRGSVGMHSIILWCPQNNGLVIDHINGNGLDNRRKNLRVCTTQANGMNRKVSKKNKFGISGVRKVEKKITKRYWRAEIVFNGERIDLGAFRTKADAIKARKEAEKKYYGEYAPQC